MFYSYGLPHKAVTFFSNAEVFYSHSTVDSNRVPFAKGCLSSRLTRHTEIFRKDSSFTLATSDHDRFTVNCLLYSVLTLWFTLRPPQKSLQKSFHQHEEFYVHYEMNSVALTV